jgi:hypothetical protein
MFCVLSWMVSRSPSHTAVVACGSSALWFCGGVVNVRSTRTGAAASAASASPFFASAGMSGLPAARVAVPCAAAKSTVAGSSW